MVLRIAFIGRRRPFMGGFLFVINSDCGIIL
nr:MAG TPA: hypothetical protein [Caudoviricetes sp.]